MKQAPGTYLRNISLFISILISLIVIYDLGFHQSPAIQKVLLWIYWTILITEALFLIVRYGFKKDRPAPKVRLFDLLLLSGILVLLASKAGWVDAPVLTYPWWIYIVLFLIFIRETLALNINLKRSNLNPAQLFIASFVLVILGGAFLLMVPKATHTGISFMDALFTSTSAVCVTGLIVVDTGTHFTVLGQSIIMILIQLGGLGIMTFTSYFSYFFKGGSSYENQLLLKDMTQSEKIADIYRTFKRIILLTLSIEGIGAFAIYQSMGTAEVAAIGEPIFFSVFHSISGFCNAGFSTLTNSLYETGFRFNYILQIVVAILFITGGLGFPIVFNFVKYLKHLLINRLVPALRFKQAIHKPWVININARIVVITTFILLTGATLLVFLFEYDHTLAEHHGIGKVITAFFTAATPRTAGFNAVGTESLRLSSLLLMLFLMWVGASPASTGGGIKTSTLAIGVLNSLSLARGRQRIEIYHREISGFSVRRAFAIMFLSLLAIGTAVFLITVFEHGQSLFPIVFECFSAYGTVGLSLGITSSLSDASKVVLILTMFIGRVSMLTILVAVLRKVRHVAYRHPTEDILIN